MARASWVAVAVMVILLPAPAVAQGSVLRFGAGAGLYSPTVDLANEQRRVGWQVSGHLLLSLTPDWLASVEYVWAKADDIAIAGEHPDRVFAGLREQRLQVAVERRLARSLWAHLGAGVAARAVVVSEVEGTPPREFYPDGNGGDERARGHFILEPGLVVRFPEVDLRITSAVISGPRGGTLNPSIALVVPIP